MPPAGLSCWRGGRIAAALRAWFAARDFVEVETAALQVSPGNETHLHAFATELIGPGGERRPLYLRTSPEFACKKLLAAGETRIFDFARVFRNRERGRAASPGIHAAGMVPGERALRDADGRLRGADGRGGARGRRQAVHVSRQDHRSVCRAGARDRGGGLRASCRHRSAGDGPRW